MACALRRAPISLTAVEDGKDAVKVEASTDAVKFIRDNGGRLFVWADDDGLKHVKLQAPDHPVDFKQIACDSFDFNVAVDIAHASFWEIVLHHFPHRYVDALWDGWAPAVGGHGGLGGP